MSNFESTSSPALSTDAELVASCLSGDRSAFAPIVERYQRLLCSIAYSATGQLSQSEDLAQETFVEAWRILPKLREPEKLRSWLCGILRHKISRMRRSDGREPASLADPIEEAAEIASHDEPVADSVVREEEQAILWSALERVPDTYRETLVLYYREHRSVEHVADALDLSEDAVKQRLSRGRKILQEQVLKFVEGALARSTPGKLFTAGVLAALPEIATPAKAAGVGAVAVKGGMIVKSTSIAGIIASLSGVIGAILTLRANLDQARTPTERRAVVKVTIAFFFGALAVLVAMYGLRAGAFRTPENALTFAIVTQVLVIGFIVGWPIALTRVMGHMRMLRTAERLKHPEFFGDARDQMGSANGEYRSTRKFLGVPLVHVRFSSPDHGEPPVFGWFAGGDRAYGLLCAWGGVAVAPFSVGAVSFGIISIGSLGVGLFSLGTIASGLFTIGCASVGVKAFAWLSALGWNAAGGGFAVAGNAAVAPLAFAPHANDQTAVDILFQPGLHNNQMLVYPVIAGLTLIPVVLYARAVRKRFGGR